MLFLILYWNENYQDLSTVMNISPSWVGIVLAFCRSFITLLGDQKILFDFYNGDQWENYFKA